MPDVIPPAASTCCPSCRSVYATRLLACPNCHRLAFADELSRLAAQADEAGRSDDLTRALGTWREALELLPPASRQHAAVSARVVELSRQVEERGLIPAPPAQPDAEPSSSPGPAWGGTAGAAGVGTLALMAWKAKFLLALVLTKGKLLLLGLTKASTFSSMLLSLGVYWSVFGWKFAAGLVLSMYVHEMGHVAALRRYGVRAGAPMFIPGLGAMVRLKQALPDARAGARVGLAGPIWGAAAAIATYLLALGLDSPALAAIARFAGSLNLLNLIPVWQLDGSRGFRTMTRPQRWLCALAIAVMWSVTGGDGLLLVLLIVAAFQAAALPPAAEPDRTATFQYVFLVVVLSTLMMIPVALPG